jgi:exocyst complex component 2
MPAAPLVTGIAPKEGYPGTKVIIRGDNLGKNFEDLIGKLKSARVLQRDKILFKIAVKICGVDCTLTADWISEKKITAYTGFCKGKGDVVVVTVSGGVGTSSVGFQGLIKKNIGPTDETAVWIDEDPKSILTGLKKSQSIGDNFDNPLGISIEDSSNITSDYLDKEFTNCKRILSLSLSLSL